MGEKEKALESLRKNKSTHLFTLATLKSCPRFDNVRNEPEFQKIVKEVETQYQKHHEQVGKFLRKWAKSNNSGTPQPEACQLRKKYFS
jgi:hypothetical protein